MFKYLYKDKTKAFEITCHTLIQLKATHVNLSQFVYLIHLIRISEMRLIFSSTALQFV